MAKGAAQKRVFLLNVSEKFACTLCRSQPTDERKMKPRKHSSRFRVYRAGTAPAPLRQCGGFSRDSRSCRAAVGGESRLHRFEPWYARCDDVDRPDHLHFDLDPTPGATFAQVRETALAVRDALAELKILSYPKTTGSRGLHIYVPIVRGPLQKDVWTFAKALAKQLETRHPKLITAEYRIAKRPDQRILVDYNQNAWGRTLASVYSVRPKPNATVSAPVTWNEVEKGVEIADCRLDNMLARLKKVGDLYRPLLLQKNRTRLERFL